MSDFPAVYEIRLAGHLDEHWCHWFEGMPVIHAQGNTILCGPVADQSALHGLLEKVRNLGLTLLTVTRVTE
ncbi:MAG: hypothetical protein ACUVWR_14475 [Anaerolineae bacterium]